MTHRIDSIINILQISKLSLRAIKWLAQEPQTERRIETCQSFFSFLMFVLEAGGRRGIERVGQKIRSGLCPDSSEPNESSNSQTMRSWPEPSRHSSILFNNSFYYATGFWSRKLGCYEKSIFGSQLLFLIGNVIIHTYTYFIYWHYKEIKVWLQGITLRNHLSMSAIFW